MKHIIKEVQGSILECEVEYENNLVHVTFYRSFKQDVDSAAGHIEKQGARERHKAAEMFLTAAEFDELAWWLNITVVSCLNINPYVEDVAEETDPL